MDIQRETANIFDVPNEIIIDCLCSDILSDNDILSFASSCHLYNNLVKPSKKLWKFRFVRRWPNVILTIVDDWFGCYRSRIFFNKKFRELIAKLAYKQYYKKNISSKQLTQFYMLMTTSEYGYHFIIDEITSLLFCTDKYQELTLKYYAEIILNYISQHITRRDLDIYLQSTEKNLEKGIYLFNIWHQPKLLLTNELEKTAQTLDEMANDIWNELLCESSNNTKLFAKYCSDSISLYSGTDTKKTLITRSEYLNLRLANKISVLTSEMEIIILKAISNYLFSQKGYTGSLDHDQWIENTFLNIVLTKKTGLPISLCVLYVLLAQRLGISDNLEILDFPKRVILRYSNHENNWYVSSFNDNRNPDTIFIDPYNGGSFMNYNELQVAPFVDHILEENDFPIADTKMVLQRMARNLIANLYVNTEDMITFSRFRYAVECSLILDPEDFDMRFLLLKLYLYLDIEFEKVIENLNDLAGRGLHKALCQTLLNEAKHKMLLDENRTLEIVKRSDPINCNVLYSVGMIMQHKRYHYTCVIISWDPVCKASDEWKLQMGVVNLEQNGEYQPFYHVLVQDGTNRYAAQENLTYCPNPVFVDHSQIGMYFEEYMGTHYVANPRKREEYPEDYEYLTHIVQKLYRPVDMKIRIYTLINEI